MNRARKTTGDRGLADMTETLAERDRLITAFRNIGEAVLSTLDLDKLLDLMTQQILAAGIFRSLTVALVERELRRLRVVRDLIRSSRPEKVRLGRSGRQASERYIPIDSKDIMAETARSGQMIVVGGWDNRFDTMLSDPEQHRDQVAYFIPVKKDDQVLAVLATGSTVGEKEDVLRRIEVMQPLLNQMAIALEHARLYADLARRETELEHRMRQREALIEFNRAVQALKRPGELDYVVQVCMKTIVQSGLDAQTVAIHRVIRAEAGEVETYRIGSAGLIFSGIRSGANELMRLWREKRTRYEDDIEQSMPDEIIEFCDKFGGMPIRSFIDVPFSMGVLSVHSTSVGAFSEIDVDLLQQIGEVFSIGVMRLDDLKNLEEQYWALEESESRFRNLIRLAKGVTYAFDWATGRYTYLDESIRELTGYAPHEFTHDLFLSLVEERSILLREEPMPNYIQIPGWTNRPSIFEAEYRLKTRDGGVVWVADYAIEFRDENRELVQSFGILQDRTERHLLEDSLRQSQKMEAVGQLAGGIAHDFNNLLTGILGVTSLMLADMASDHPMRDDVEEIRRAGDRAASLTRQLLAFSRKQVLQPKLLDLNGVLIDMQKMLRRLIREDIDLVVSMGTAQGNVLADPGQLEQVIMNLVVNARDAMPQGGTLTIETDCVVMDESASRLFGQILPGRYVSMTVRDTGTGMDSKLLPHIFEPFFTTKDPGVGTGMGLAMVYGIVKQSDGYIDVVSESNKGTTFTVYLPHVDVPEDAPQERSDQFVIPGGNEAILLVEDEELVRRLTQRVLQDLGYRVLVAADGVEALDLWGSCDETIDLVVTDVVMPGMGGKELIAQLLARCSDLAVLFISGHSDEMVNREEALPAGAGFLHKPFTPDELAKKIREMLDV